MKRTLRTVAQIILMFASTLALTAQPDFEAVLIMHDGTELGGTIKNFSSTSKKIKLKTYADDEYQSIESKDVKFMQIVHWTEESSAIFHYTKEIVTHTKTGKEKSQGTFWHNVLYSCSDILVLENFISVKQKKKRGLMLTYQDGYASDFILKKMDNEKADILALGVSRFKSRIIGTNTRNKRSFAKYFEDHADILEKIENTRKLDFNIAMEIVDMYCTEESM